MPAALGSWALGRRCAVCQESGVLRIEQHRGQASTHFLSGSEDPATALLQGCLHFGPSLCICRVITARLSSLSGIDGAESGAAPYDEHMRRPSAALAARPDRLKTLNPGGRRRKKREE